MSRMWCSSCQRMTTHRKGMLPFHQVLLHILLMLVTCGLWTPVYLLFVFQGHTYCRECGR